VNSRVAVSAFCVVGVVTADSIADPLALSSDITVTLQFSLVQLLSVATTITAQAPRGITPTG
jgi:hypothetical protein